MANSSKKLARQQPKIAWEHITEWWNDNMGNSAQAAVPMSSGYKQKVKQDLNNTFQLNQTPEEMELERRKAKEYSDSFR